MKSSHVTLMCCLVPVIAVVVFGFTATHHLNLRIDLDSIQKVEVMGLFEDMTAFDEEHCYTDIKKIKKTLDYLDKLPLVKSSYEELPNMSPDGILTFYDHESNVIIYVGVYSGEFIKASNSDQYYKCKHSWTWITKDLLEMKFD